MHTSMTCTKTSVQSYSFQVPQRADWNAEEKEHTLSDSR